ncbi:CwfJ C-terminus 1-domain-containing protein-like protein [Pestalotiopsis sp. NC0098]|nr:CwfJ C-terminus 1-domain-containing protein-like protein [Pestalotiopsis sp. NC0098]
MAAKVIVFGSLGGKLESAFGKLATLHAKNNFSFAIVAGNLFESSEEGDSIVTRLLNGEIKVPLPTYFTVGTTPLPPQVIERIEKDEDICENLHYLGKRSINKTSDGIRIVTLGGALDSSIVGQSKEQHLPFHTASDATALRGANKADILLTTTWPQGVWTNSRVALAPEHQAAIPSSQEIADLCNAIKPRYHFSFSPADFFWEREPFFYAEADESGERPVTRFISMAPFGNAAKAKAMYAFTLQSGDSSAALPPGSTLSPFVPARPAKRQEPGGQEQSNRHTNDRHGRRGRQRHERPPPPGPQDCFFCLSNPSIETHLVCSIGEHSYVTTAKGPLPGLDTFSASGIPFTGHQIIIPLAHEPTLRAVPAEGLLVYSEMSRYKEALQAMVAKQSNHKLGALTWEISRSRNIHAHWQFVPVPIDFLQKGLVEAAFKVEAENLKYPPLTERTLGSGMDEEGDFLRLWIWYDDSDAAIHGKELVMSLDDSFRFDLQFPRKVLAKLLELENRIDWRASTFSVEDETADADRLKEAFKPWDFSLA